MKRSTPGSGPTPGVATKATPGSSGSVGKKSPGTSARPTQATKPSAGNPRVITVDPKGTASSPKATPGGTRPSTPVAKSPLAPTTKTGAGKKDISGTKRPSGVSDIGGKTPGVNSPGTRKPSTTLSGSSSGRKDATSRTPGASAGTRKSFVDGASSSKKVSPKVPNADRRAGSNFGGSFADGTKSVRQVKSSGGNCGHNTCSDRNSCAFKGGNSCGNWSNGSCGWNSCDWNDSWNFGIAFGSGGWGFSFGYSNWNCGSGWGGWSGWNCWPSYNYCYSPCWRPRYWCGPYYNWGWSSYWPAYSYGCYQPSYVTYNTYYTDSDAYAYLDAPAAEGYAWLDESTSGATTAEWTETTFEDYNAAAGEATVTTGDGWELLAHADAREARRAFTHAMNAHPADSLPKIGYAISAALLDRDQESVAVMREALRLDAESIMEVPQSPALASQVQALIDRYRMVGFDALGERDLHFMVAVMLTLKGELAMAYYAIDTTSEQGDNDASTTNLKAVLRSALNGPSAPPAPESRPATSEKPAEVLY